MTVKNKIRRRFGDILDVYIQDGAKLATYIDSLDTEGKLTRKTQLLLIIELFNAIEVLEKALEDQALEIELIKTAKEASNATPNGAGQIPNQPVQSAKV